MKLIIHYGLNLWRCALEHVAKLVTSPEQQQNLQLKILILEHGSYKIKR
ncbi:hypothetical protein Patl1_10361 [Pistacia atlantica]|uniref:Uncharacterized protein n=1 Tax=Pistacia atlantica TaxID=434234 RepID=A0ACC1A7C8_9ROSI|nr:hypothetical protein Patl1_10361 [Pistacia atlantica]